MSLRGLVDCVDDVEGVRRPYGFPDYTLYQTPAYQFVRADASGDTQSLVVIKAPGDRTVLMADVRIREHALLEASGWVTFNPDRLLQLGRVFTLYTAGTAGAKKGVCRTYS